jgi:hypothetical protein
MASDDDLAFCERVNYVMPPPPPNRVVRIGFGGEIETGRSKSLRHEWNRLMQSWRGWNLDRRKRELCMYLHLQDDLAQTIMYARNLGDAD